MVLRNDVFTKILHLPMLYFTGSRTGELMSRTLNDTQMVERGITEVISDLVQQPFVLVGAAAYLFFIDLRLALVSLAIFPVCLLPIAIFGKRVRRHAKAGQERIADLSSIQQEAIGGAAIVKAYGMEATNATASKSTAPISSAARSRSSPPRPPSTRSWSSSPCSPPAPSCSTRAMRNWNSPTSSCFSAPWS
jgi:ABC-type multidrug transport system fused ATPase/permease subunit